ncbi:hypothetical protein [Thalassotalea atypica]|uniref:hypothetical protein n=1 Tax=Thalassotalea atypica TaxID=2054316 RepID=UPI0025729BEA|nr:hypothetical protein [Thalassotalea atypica]
MDKQQVIQVGGDIEESLKGNYKINPKAVLEEAWQKTNNSRASINIGLCFVFFVGMIISMVASHLLGGIEQVLEDPNALNLVNLIVNIAIWPFLAGIEMMGVLHAVGLKTEAKLTFAFLKRGSWVVLCALFTSVLVSLGLQLFIIPGIFLAVALSLTIPLVVEKHLSPMKAIILSVKVLRFQWFNIFAIYFVLMGGLVLSILPVVVLINSELVILGAVLCLFILSYLAPCYFNAKGILYREIFGMRLQTVSSEQSISDDIFTA